MVMYPFILFALRLKVYRILYPVFSSLSDSTHEVTHCWSAVGIAVATATVVAFITGVLAGIIAYHYINKHQLQTTKPESSSHQQQQPAGPVYEEVFATSAKEKLELKANVAYGPVQH